MNKSKEMKLALDNLEKIELGNFDRPNQRLGLINQVRQYINNSNKENELYIRALTLLFEILGLELDDNTLYVLTKNKNCYGVDLYGSEHEILKEIEDKINELKKGKD